MDKDFKNKTPEELKAIVAKYGGKEYLSKYIFTYLHQHNLNDINLMTTLSKDMRKRIVDDGYYITQLKIEAKLVDPDGTVKYLFQTADGNKIESVLLDENGRKTICVSTQVGCRLGCKFCATGALGFQRNLDAGEIIDQVSAICADSGCKVNNLVYMGMGEPLENYDNTMRAVRINATEIGKQIGFRRQTISTVGIPEAIRKLADEDVFPRLAVSLHSADDGVRKEIVPAAHKYSLKELLSAMKYYNETTGRRITIEYCMIDGVNDSFDLARKLIQYIRPLKVGVNLIEYNPHPGADYQPARREQIKEFKDMLMQAGFETIIRFRRGQAVKAACGQLGADRLSENKTKDEDE
ncbi:MAG: 23S rRNA (adenine(2503)-C(2))-methyltransferase [Planctomycetes bacterium GWF2_41_51]|nr:MAG: 23S rRNA (adenine(2503)-C(2))-methyltransferase [Planctomycetes bacterium GWF2_41_51]HBG27474.1 23S rRNA (adenine(2503)-C(2))-methyltransferase RlmN [Phycisphaerales bacterium]